MNSHGKVAKALRTMVYLDRGWPLPRFDLGEHVQGLSQPGDREAMAEGTIQEQTFSGGEWVYRFAGECQLWPEQRLRRSDGTSYAEMIHKLNHGALS